MVVQNDAELEDTTTDNQSAIQKILVPENSTTPTRRTTPYDIREQPWPSRKQTEQARD